MGDTRHVIHSDISYDRQGFLDPTSLQAGNNDFIHVMTVDVLFCWLSVLTATMNGVKTSQHIFHHTQGL